MVISSKFGGALTHFGKLKKMKKILLIIAGWAGCLGLSAQDIVSNNLGEFDRISLTGKMNVVLVQGDRNSFEVTLHNAEADRFSWTVSNGKLNLRLRANTQRESSADVKITYNGVNALEVSGASVRGENTFTGDIFTLTVNNGGNATVSTQSKDVTVQADGNSAATLSGKTLYLSINANSKAKIDARALEARAAFVSTQLGAEVFVWGTEKLDARAGSNSIIFYKGTPELFKKSTSLMGSIEQFSY